MELESRSAWSWDLVCRRIFRTPVQPSARGDSWIRPFRQRGSRLEPPCADSVGSRPVPIVPVFLGSTRVPPAQGSLQVRDGNLSELYPRVGKGLYSEGPNRACSAPSVVPFQARDRGSSPSPECSYPQPGQEHREHSEEYRESEHARKPKHESGCSEQRQQKSGSAPSTDSRNPCTNQQGGISALEEPYENPNTE